MQISITDCKLSRRDHRVMDFLRRQAIDNEGCARQKLAAAVAIKGRIISLGRNQYKTHPFATAYGKHSEAIFLHAEAHAIVTSLTHINRENLARATLYIYRVKRPSHKSKQWTNGISKPCAGCMSAIVEFGFKRVVYTTDNEHEYRVLQ